MVTLATYVVVYMENEDVFKMALACSCDSLVASP